MNRVGKSAFANILGSLYEEQNLIIFEVKESFRKGSVKVYKRRIPPDEENARMWAEKGFPVLILQRCPGGQVGVTLGLSVVTEEV